MNADRHWALFDQAEFQRLFSDIPMPKHPLDDERAAPMVQPDPELIDTVRAGIDLVKQQAGR